MTETTLEVSNPGDVLTLFGTRDQHIRAIRSRCDVSITHRNGRIRVAGEHREVRTAMRVLKQMRAVLERRGSLLPQDVDSILDEQIAAAEKTAGAPRSGGDRPRPSGSPLFGGGPLPGPVDIDIHQAGRRVKPRTEGQAVYVDAIHEHDLTFCVGPAGTGKTYLAVACAVEALKAQTVRKIVLVRPAVEAGENLGFLPGDLRAKLNPYLRPLLDALNEMIDFDRARTLMEQDIIEVIPLAYMRGRTLNDSFIILDEAQNTTVAQMKMFLTRMGERSRMVVSGDTSQLDLPRGVQSGLRDAILRLGGIKEIGMVRLQKTDIVRHKLVQRIVRAYEEQEG